MGSFNHQLKGNKTSELPRNWLIFDCEAKIDGEKNEQQIHTLKLGCGRYRRFQWGNHKERLTDFDFYTPEQFWDKVLVLCERDRRLIVMGYNVGYDIRLVKGFQVLHKYGYRQTRIYVGGSVAIMEWRKDKHRIVVIDACNFFDGKLETWGDMFNLPKGKVDFRTASNEILLKYCWRDVEILDLLLRKWLEFLDVHDVGSFKPTRASQCFAAFCHRFMNKAIYIHTNTRALAIERQAYHGGRTECFHIGKLTAGPYYKLDVNNMYPYVMRSSPVPIKLKSVAVSLDVADIRRLVKRYALCGEFVVNTNEPVYIYQDGLRLLYPIGRFVTWLSTPEIVYALERGHIETVRRVSIYEKAVLFREYVDYFYKIRLEYRQQGNKVFASMVKYFLLSLYGKFGQKSERWVQVDNELGDPDGEYIILNDDTRKMIRYVIIAGERWNIEGQEESYNSFPAIAAHITAAARVYLWQLICVAGRDQVYYCDTDSLITTRTGKERLEAYMDDKELGKLKVEYTTESLIIHSPKEYQTDKETKRKGIKADAVEIRPRVFRQMHWEKLRGSFLAGTSDKVRLTPVIKDLNRPYTKGVIHSSGSVSPLVLDAV